MGSNNFGPSMVTQDSNLKLLQTSCGRKGLRRDECRHARCEIEILRQTMEPLSPSLSSSLLARAIDRMLIRLPSSLPIVQPRREVVPYLLRLTHAKWARNFRLKSNATSGKNRWRVPRPEISFSSGTRRSSRLRPESVTQWEK